MQVRETKAGEKAQFRALHEGKYLPLKKRCVAFERCASAGAKLCSRRTVVPTAPQN